MVTKTKSLGVVKLVQVQPTGLIFETPSGYIYDPSRRVEVDQLRLTPAGIEATTTEGQQVLDIHHSAHPDTHFEGDNAISIGFSAHYAAMRARFGDHLVDGSAGENIIIDFESEIWLEDLGGQIGFQDPNNGQWVLMDVLNFASPCEEFSHFAADSQASRLPVDQLKSTLQFLSNGRRGFLLALSEGQELATVQPGDQVFVVVGS
jgi:hypothetical protein